MALHYSKFKATGSGVEFLYSNKDNSLYTTDFKPLILNKDGFKNIPESGKFTKSSRPKHLRIAMGKLCNMSCSYCLQEDLAGLEDILDPNVDKFLEDLQKLNLEGLERVELWGGETFAYWPTMKRIFKVLDRPNVVWYLPTNGTLLNNKHVDYLKELEGNIAIGISHDGPKTGLKQVRGRDPFPRLGPVLKYLNDNTNISYSLNATLSQDNNNLLEVYKGFSDLKETYGLTRMGMEFDKVESYDFMSYTKTIHGDALEEYRKSMRDFFLYTESIGEKKTNLHRDMTRFAESIKGASQTSLQSRCGADWEELISVDINGDVLSCPMVSSKGHKCGTIDKIDEVKTVGLEFMREHNGNGDGCKNCQVLLLCNKGCPLKLADTFRSRSCALLKVHNSEIQLAAFRLLFKDNIEFIGKIPENEVKEWHPQLELQA